MCYLQLERATDRDSSVNDVYGSRRTDWLRGTRKRGRDRRRRGAVKQDDPRWGFGERESDALRALGAGRGRCSSGSFPGVRVLREAGGGGVANVH